MILCNHNEADNQFNTFENTGDGTTHLVQQDLHPQLYLSVSEKHNRIK